MSACRLIAYYLPQFHPIPENDEWWGKGFTEWTNVAKAKPLFKGHYQPHLPADLGFYDLRVPEVREAQAAMARDCGIEAFCYWHYWFAGKRLLNRVFDEVLESGRPDFPFCLAWANQTWSGIWHGDPGRVLIEQTYPGEDDYRQHFSFLLRAFADRRYVRVNGKPLLFIFQPHDIPQCRKVIEYWRTLAKGAGLPGLHTVCLCGYEEVPLQYEPNDDGFDGFTNHILWAITKCRPVLRASIRRFTDGKRFLGRLGSKLFPDKEPKNVYYYKDAVLMWDGRLSKAKASHYPTVVPNWDASPRCGSRGWILHESTPELFELHLRKAVELVQQYPAEERLVFLKSWNEWAEGNYVEPDQRYGHGYLQAIKRAVLME